MRMSDPHHHHSHHHVQFYIWIISTQDGRKFKTYGKYQNIWEIPKRMGNTKTHGKYQNVHMAILIDQGFKRLFGFAKPKKIIKK